MTESLIIIGKLAGGLGLFLLAVSMVTDGLKLAAGHTLRDMLGRWTRTPAHGIALGVSITAIVQSSSAVTVATIGFVNAGLINLYQALGVVYGANIGTTMTGWLVAVVGFEVNIESFALPMIGIGMLLRMTDSDSRRGAIGLALTGFGMFFIGINVLKEAFDGLTAAIDLQKYTLDGLPGVFMYMGIGFVMTMLTQSSSAAIAITLSAAAGGILGLYAAAAMVIGANVGTTSTAVIAAIGATPNAKRVAAAHVVFNAVTGVVALMILPLLFWTVNVTSHLLGLADIPAFTLALFHTAFNILGVLLMWPLSKRLTLYLEKRFVTQEEIESRPRYLDKNVVVSPLLAVNALALEMSRIASISRRMSLYVLNAESISETHIARDHSVVSALAYSMDEFITLLEKTLLTTEVAEQLAQVLRVEQHLLACAQQAHIVARSQIRPGFVEDEELIKQIAHFRAEVVSFMVKSDLEAEDFSFAACAEQLEQVQTAYDDVKTLLLHAGAELRISVPRMIDVLEQNSNIRRMTRQMYKAIQLLSELYRIAEVQVPEPSPAEITEAADTIL